ncbi:hypothetical protein [Hansschlegelia zhihuaiae]|uniref:Uncharacterized protein n=1 Tax=Hansschlegelia zhihuaiae TaxID=405005 RepID=A0A4Q0MHH4_9HYPH|nr:hypothetical protein [Hansschlegelia zhihuaiae]RXF73031.1 hypothetical protein EK403_12935 [Hansschlegelia zhihuaiae]
MRLLRLAALALAISFGVGTLAHAQEFRHRGWVGARLPGDKDSGCAMGRDVRGGALVVYANAAGGLRIGLGSRELQLEMGKEAIGAATFDDSPPILLKGAAISANTVLFDLMEKAPDGALARLIEASRGVKLTYAGRSLVARLSGSERAIKLLRDCAAGPDPIEAPPVAQGAGASSGERAAEFGFLRQGMELGDANTKLLDAGWQAETPVGRADDPAAKPLRDRGVSGGTCSGTPTSCVLDYADAYGNALRLTVAGDEARVRNWRLNPPDEGARAGPSEDPDPPASPAAGERGP